MTDETKVEEKDEQAETTNAQAPALKNPVLLGRKLGMLQHFKEDGSVVGATIIVAEANVVTQVRTKERDGYSAIQLGFGRAKKPERMTKAELGHLKDLPPMRVLREVRLDDIDGFATGQEIGVDRFAAGDKVQSAECPRARASRAQFICTTSRVVPSHMAPTICAVRARSARALRPAACSRGCAWRRTKVRTRSPFGTSRSCEAIRRARSW